MKFGSLTFHKRTLNGKTIAKCLEDKMNELNESIILRSFHVIEEKSQALISVIYTYDEKQKGIKNG